MAPGIKDPPNALLLRPGTNIGDKVLSLVVVVPSVYMKLTIEKDIVSSPNANKGSFSSCVGAISVLKVDPFTDKKKVDKPARA